MFKLLQTCLMVSMVFALAACDTTKPPPTLRSDALPMDQYPQSVAMEGLEKWLVAQKPTIEAGTNQTPMRVSVPVRSVADVPVNVQYRFEFFDRTGAPVRGNQGWQFMNIPARVQVFMQGNAMDNDAVDFRLQIRPAR